MTHSQNFSSFCLLYLFSGWNVSTWFTSLRLYMVWHPSTRSLSSKWIIFHLLDFNRRKCLSHCYFLILCLSVLVHPSPWLLSYDYVYKYCCCVWAVGYGCTPRCIIFQITAVSMDHVLFHLRKTGNTKLVWQNRVCCGKCIANHLFFSATS